MKASIQKTFSCSLISSEPGSPKFVLRNKKKKEVRLASKEMAKLLDLCQVTDAGQPFKFSIRLEVSSPKIRKRKSTNILSKEQKDIFKGWKD